MDNTAAIKIINWYKAIRVPSNSEEIVDKQTMVRYYTLHHPDNCFLNYPAFMIKKMNMDLLPPIKTGRKESRDFLMRKEISLDDIVVSGW